MYKFLLPFVLSIGTLSFAAAQAEQPGPLRLGVGASSLNFQHAAKGVPDGKLVNANVFAEFAQNNYVATRLTFYRGKDAGGSLYGGETQLLVGYGLAKSGPRIYTGPTWHLEHLHINDLDFSHSYKGWGWQAGLGWQYKAIALDYSFGIRDNHRYNKTLKPLGFDGHALQNNIYLSYKF